MAFDDGAGDGQTEADAGVCGTWLDGMEGAEDGGEALGFNAEAVIANFDDDAAAVIGRGDGDMAVGAAEFDGVFEQIPKHLIETGELAPCL